MENQKVRKLVLSALMAALVYVATSIIQIPSPVNGYVNLGDCFVLLSGWLLGPWYGAAAAGIGSMLVDLLSGYGHYVPGTSRIFTSAKPSSKYIFIIRAPDISGKERRSFSTPLPSSSYAVSAVTPR